MRLSYYISILFLCLSLIAYSQNDVVFSQANDAYADGNYEEARRLYQNIIKDGEVSSELYYNLGNTFYKLENIPQSIYYYEKALKLNPKDENILNNLSFAERMRLDQFQSVPENDVQKGFNSIITLFSVDQWSIVGIILLFIAGLLFGYYLFFRKPSLKRLLFGLSLVFIVLAIGSFAMAQRQLNIINTTTYAIIFDKEKDVLEEPNPKSNILLEIHEGTKVKILDEFRSYYQIELPDGTIGWITIENVKSI